MARKLLKLDSNEGLMDFLKLPSILISEVLTGILISDQKDWKLSAGKLIQATIKGKLLTQFGEEITKYQEQGKIKEDYFATHKSKATLFELLKFLDEEVPDEELFNALKSIFFYGVKNSSTTYEETLAYEFMKTAKRLTGTEVMILKANYEIATHKSNFEIHQDAFNQAREYRSSWRRIIAKQMGYGDMDSVVSKYEHNLEALGLISPRYEMDRLQSQFEPTSKLRLTEMGFKFCEFITNIP